jgi:uncharacterized protein RhaS with RHS repeats
MRRHDNRFRKYDPSVGRYISADPIGQAGGVNLYAYARNDAIDWFDPFGLIEGSASNKAKRTAIAQWAAAQNGSTAFAKSGTYAPGYSYDSGFGPQYPARSWKCSAFTCAAAASGGADTKVTVPNGSGGTVDRCATAGELAGNNGIPNWRVLGPGEAPEPGDIAAVPLSGGADYTGHAAVVTGDGAGGTTTVGAHAGQVGPPGADVFPTKPTYRRFTGD